MNEFYDQMTHRTGMVLGKSVLERVGRTRVIIFGVGGVGSWCAEALVRSGLMHLTLVDSDIICPTNINRQLQATSSNIGNSKVGEIKKRLLDINPYADIEARHEVFEEESAERFDLESFDYVIDAIDSLKNKVLLIERCIASGLKFYSSMGAGSRTDPTKIKVDLLSKTVNCPLARVVRRSLRKKEVTTDFLCVYSDELPVEPVMESLCGTGKCACVHDRAEFGRNTGVKTVDWCGLKKRVNGALVHITAIFGFTLAGLVINDIMREGE